MASFSSKENTQDSPPIFHFPWLSQPSDTIICSCQAWHFYDDDDPVSSIRPSKVALHNATDHWRKEEDRFIRIPKQKTTPPGLKTPRPDPRRSTSPTKRKHCSHSRSPYTRATKRELPDTDSRKTHNILSDSGHTSNGSNVSSDQLSEAISEYYRENPEHGYEHSESGIAEEEKTVGSESLLKSIESPPDEQVMPEANEPRPLENRSRNPKPKSLPPNLKGGRLLPSRLLQSERQVSASHSADTGTKIVFDGFTPKPKRVYGKGGLR